MLLAALTEPGNPWLGQNTACHLAHACGRAPTPQHRTIVPSLRGTREKPNPRGAADGWGPTACVPSPHHPWAAGNCEAPRAATLWPVQPPASVGAQLQNAAQLARQSAQCTP
eukprot:3130159-Pyramimonas_sp.AAC.1